jgi:hypothetical protein
MTLRQLKRVWPKVRSSINARGRFDNYQRRQQALTTESRNRVERENAVREAALRQRITVLERERDESRSAANYILSQYHQ